MDDIVDDIFATVDNFCLGDSQRGLKELCSDLLHSHGGKDNIDAIVAGTFLCKSTLYRVMDCEENYRPQSETLERILRYCGAEVVIHHVKISSKNQNKPKE